MVFLILLSFILHGCITINHYSFNRKKEYDIYRRWEKIEVIPIDTLINPLPIRKYFTLKIKVEV